MLPTQHVHRIKSIWYRYSSHCRTQRGIKTCRRYIGRSVDGQHFEFQICPSLRSSIRSLEQLTKESTCSKTTSLSMSLKSFTLNAKQALFSVGQQASLSLSLSLPPTLTEFPNSASYIFAHGSSQRVLQIIFLRPLQHPPHPPIIPFPPLNLSICPISRLHHLIPRFLNESLTEAVAGR